MTLTTYRAKRNFRHTPEPRGRARTAKRPAWSFVVQKHAARALHYDFRLEQDGVLLSWAIPKGPSLDPADKRLAMHVEDHPLEYGEFEGVIPAGEYGGGTVLVWDRGSWTPQGDPVAGYRNGELKFTLDGEKLKGGWVLVRTRGSKYGGKTGDKAWLLIKERDEFSRSGNGAIVDSAPQSVATGRDLAEIAASRENVWHSNRSVEANVKAGAIAKKRPAAKARNGRRSAAAKEGARAAKMPAGARAAKLPAMLSPMLATPVTSAPPGPEWVHEIKYDGYRMLGRIENGKAKLVSRNAKDWTSAFAGIAADLARLPVRAAWVDGETVVLDSAGRTSFQALQNALMAKGAPLSFFAFDLIHLDGYDLRKVPLTERRRLLREIVGDGVGAVRVGPEVRGHGEEFLRQACSIHLEGAVCKRADSLYHDGARTREWVKVKCTRRQEMVIGGFTDPRGSRSGFGALLLGIYDDGKLRYSGKVGTGFDERTLAALHKLLVARERKTPAFVNPPRGFEAKGAHWVLPDLVAEIAFTEWSNDGALRHPTFQGLRADKKAMDVVREELQAAPSHAPKAAGKTSGAAAKTAGATKPTSATKSTSATKATTIAGIAISHPDKIYFPEAGITKAEVAAYFERMASWIVPHVEDRPLSLVRCPDGWNKQCFYQKHADKGVNEAVDRIEVPEGNGTATYMGARNAKALVALLQWGVLELHPWGSRSPRLDRPDRLIFDFDPDDGVAWKDLVTAVELLHTLLSELGLQGFLKTTGGKGLHVVVPVRATLDWTQAKGFSRAVADLMVRSLPDRFIATVSKAKRKGKILIDYLRNAEGATAIAPYAIRARAHAPVAMPIGWNELGTDVRFGHFNLRNAEERLKSQKTDPWREFMTTRQSITRAHGKRVGFVL